MSSLNETIPPIRPRLGPAALPRTDKQLAKRAAAGDEAAFAAIFRRHSQDLYRYCHSLLRDPQDAEDALQSTMTSALRSLPGEARAIALKPWLFRVAHNHAISILRGRRPDAVSAELVDEVADRDLDDRLAARERLRTLLRDLDQLNERQRAALTMRELSDLSFDEIAGSLSISAQAARQAVYEARLSLRELESGRSMGCEQVTRVISDGDGRALRSRRIRAHLRSCEGCRDFRRAIDSRSADLAAISPPLPAVALVALLKGAFGSSATPLIGGGAGAGAAVAAAGQGIGASVALKSIASLVAAGAIGVGVADRTGWIDISLGGGGETAAQRTAEPGAPGASSPRSATGNSTSTASRPERGAPGQSASSRVGAAARRGDAKPGNRPAEPGPAEPVKGAPGTPGQPPQQSSGLGTAEAPGLSGSAGNPQGGSAAAGGAPSSSSAAGGNPPESAAGGNPPANGPASPASPAAQSGGAQQPSGPPAGVDPPSSPPGPALPPQASPNASPNATPRSP